MDDTLVGIEHLLEVRPYDEALRRVSAYLRTVPDDGYAVCMLARCHLGRGDAVSALRAACAALRSTPDSAWGHRLRSIALVELGRHREAVTAARESVRLAPHDWHAHDQLSLAMYRRSSWRQRREAYNAPAARSSWPRTSRTPT
jgi:predicted Zn-dependent protease